MAPDRIAGRYTVQRAAGRGGMGTVWLCIDEVLGRQVAVKEVGTLPGEDSLDLARALREARSSAALNHRNVVSVFDAVEEGDRIWLVMEYVPGRTLSEILAQDGPLSAVQVAHIGAQVAEGLAAAHARGTIHRDVKPGNILVSDDGTAKISDFGISRTMGDAQVTRTGMVIGTPTYFAPELARGEDPTPAVDVWALGATLYAAVEGRPLFPEQQNPLAMLNEIASRPAPRPQQAGFLTEPIIRSLDPDPRSRWSMADLAHVLRRLDQRHAGGHTRPVTAALAAVTPASGQGSSVDGDDHAEGDDVDSEAPYDQGPEEHTGVAAPSRRDGRGGRIILIGLVALLLLAAAGGLLLLRDLSGGSTEDVAGSPGTSESPRAERGAERDRTVRSTPTATPTATPTPTASPTSAPSPTGTPPASEPDPAPVAGGAAEQFVADYYAALPTDTETAWSSLSAGMQEQLGYDSYRGFWNTIADVTVTGTRSAGAGAVEVSLTYTKPDGSSEAEVRRILVERSGVGYVITGDEVVG